MVVGLGGSSRWYRYRGGGMTAVVRWFLWSWSPMVVASGGGGVGRWWHLSGDGSSGDGGV